MHSLRLPLVVAASLMVPLVATAQIRVRREGPPPHPYSAFELSPPAEVPMLPGGSEVLVEFEIKRAQLKGAWPGRVVAMERGHGRGLGMMTSSFHPSQSRELAAWIAWLHASAHDALARPSSGEFSRVATPGVASAKPSTATCPLSASDTQSAAAA